MLRKTRLAVAVGTILTLGIALPALAEGGIVVEELPLSGSKVETQAIPKPGKIESAPIDSNGSTATASGTGGGDTSSNPRWELYQQVQELQDQVQKLQGTVEEQNHTIERMRSDQKARYTDLDQRLNTLNDRVTQLQQAPAQQAPAASTSAPAENSEPPSANIEEEKKSYLAAYEVFRSQGADKAIPPMLTFVSRYPKSTFAPNAYYWLGEFYLAATPADLASARKNFETVLSGPNNSKVPAALYKLGTIADLQKKPDEAKKRMQDVLTRFPGSPEAALAKAYLNPPADDTPAPQPKPAEKPKTPAKAKKHTSA